MELSGVKATLVEMGNGVRPVELRGVHGDSGDAVLKVVRQFGGSADRRDQRRGYWRGECF